MEKINKEELMKKLNLTDEELEMVTGGSATEFKECVSYCTTHSMLIHSERTPDECVSMCRRLYPL